MLTGVAGYTVGGPSVHALNAEWGHAGMSLGLRAVPYAVWGLLLEADHNESVRNAAFAAGALAAMVVDGAWLARRSPPKGAASCWVFTPSVEPSRRSASLSVGGRF